MTELMGSFEASHTPCSGFHPQTNGQVERYNQTLVSPIQRYVYEQLDDWDQHANAPTYACNSQVHQPIGFSPFEIIIITPPCHMALENVEKSRNQRIRKQNYSQC